ncbi:CHAT domain-containing protein [Marinobacter salsuginis]|uniref:CHAT domain-containing protein n=1 Tax=Marinobacter salsuginis TaxID=418719 RepID=A0A5M3PUA3_9GAMM|nr:CHAT domain-containing protein [Marinobacter salsuginis]GBO86289.1 hypothetical protein MS5N3_37400 [Marinobacter salsuginis]
MDEQKPAFHGIQGFNPAEYFANGFNRGSADIIQGGSLREVVGRTVTGLLNAAIDEDGRYLFTGATIILPPITATEISKESAFESLILATQELQGNELTKPEESNLRQLVRIVNTSSLNISDLLQVVRKEGNRRLIAIASASQYRDPKLDLPPPFGVTAVRSNEDRWTPHVTSMGQQLVPVLQELDGYGLVHVMETPAQSPANVELLCSIESVYVVGLHTQNSPEEALIAHAQKWKSMVLQGRISEVITELEDSVLPIEAQLHALIQLLRGTGHNKETLELIRRLRPHLDGRETWALIQVASLAYQAGDAELANEILPKGTHGVGDQEWLEKGLELALQLEDNDRIARFDERVAELFSFSPRLRENRDRRLLMNIGRLAESNSVLFTTAGFTNHHKTLQARLASYETNFEVVIQEATEWGIDWKELATVCCALRAQSLGYSREAAEIASTLTASELYGRQATQTLISSIKSMMLKELIPEDKHDDYRYFFLTAFQFLANHPEDGAVRSRLTELLSVESCGDLGIPILALTMLDLVQKGVTLARPTDASADAHDMASDEKIETSIKKVLLWFNEQGGAEPGVTISPRELLLASPDEIVRSVSLLVNRIMGQKGEDVDLVFMQQMVAVACAICPHAQEERNEDIRLMRLMGSQLTVERKFQQARNLAEQILLMGQTNAYRRRLAWQAFGDIYHRCHNNVVALVGLASALAVDVPVEKADLWSEVYVIHRILRDLGLFRLSRATLPTLKGILTEHGFNSDRDPRYIHADLSLRLMETDDDASEPLKALLTDVVKACRQELEDRNHLLPLAVLLGQTVRKAEGAGVKIPSEVQTTLHSALKQLGANIADMVKAISVDKPIAKDVLALFQKVERAAYASDVAQDYAVLGLAARRLLCSEVTSSPTPLDDAFATEILADHTVHLFSDAPAMTVEWPSQYAVELNYEGLGVAFLALNSSDELSVVCITDGKAYAIEQPKHERNFRDRFQEWLQNYPRDYGRVDREEGNNIFYLTMENLDLRLPETKRLILVAEPFLQQLTANLVVVLPVGSSFGHFAGTECAIGNIPSLTWLSTARSAQRSPRTNYKAWISADPECGFGDMQKPRFGAQEGGDREPTLNIALDRLGNCFEEFGFTVNNERQLPKTMQDASLAVVTAHGGLNRGGHYLHSIRDDEELIVSPPALAASLAGVELVILFVCSGGRIDKNPWDNSTSSLPKQLLNNGTRAVIASPWPLNVIVTYNWLEPFLRAWEAGSTVLDATKKANDAVASKLGEVPQYSLAMRVYGDALLTKLL